jgi:hypothetical protein
MLHILDANIYTDLEAIPTTIDTLNERARSIVSDTLSIPSVLQEVLVLGASTLNLARQALGKYDMIPESKKEDKKALCTYIL